MKRFLYPFVLAIIALLASITSLKAQNPTMDAQWTVKSNDGTQLVLELGIRTNTPHEHLGRAQFVFEYDNTYVNFAGGGNGVNGTDYNWIDSFGSSIYAGTHTGVAQLAPGILDVQLTFPTAMGAAIPSIDFTPLVDLVFAVAPLASNQSTTITWAMSEVTPGTFDDVTDDNALNPTSFDEGTLNGLTVNPLPVTLCDFKARLNNSVAALSWTTASEINNDYFTIERSSDGSNFDLVVQIKGSGNSEAKKEYMSYDSSPLPGFSYYRLKQTDFNGASQTFKMISINNTDVASETIQITNTSVGPSKALLTYKMPDDETLTIIATDMHGNIIHKDQVTGKRGINNYAFSDATTWKPGIYDIIIIGKSQSTSAKVFIP